MKIKIIPTLISQSVLAAILATTTSSVWAAGTEAGTDIDNTATISYSVSGTSQTPIESSEAGNSVPGSGSATTFKVDKKVDLLVTTGSGVNVAPGASGATTSISFTVKNEGNSDENFTLATTGISGGDFDTSLCSVTSPASPVAIAQDIIQAVTVECTVPPSNGGTVSNGKTSNVDLLATANVLPETTGTETAGTVDIVYADDAGTATDSPNGAVSGDQTRNAKHSATNTYTINTADITVAKTSAVTADPFNGGTNPKRIPGATIEYTITVSNAIGAATATGINIADTVPSDLTVVGTPTITGGTSTLAAASGNAVSTTPFDLAAGQTATLTVIATVN